MSRARPQSRRDVAFPKANGEAWKPDTVGDDLIGLSLSGGGIRSAMFNLGLLQALHGNGLLRYVDYLSTVSGGGLIGSTVSSLLASPNASATPDRFPLGFDAGRMERFGTKAHREQKR